MTAIRDRRSDPDVDDATVKWDDRPIAGGRPGLPWWGAVLVAFGLAVVGAIADMQLHGDLSWIFQGCYFIGSVGAICAVRRRNLFGPMIQSPLVLAVTVPAVVLFASGLPAGSDTLGKAIAVGTPLINGFPTMAITSGIVLAIGFFRIYRERDPDKERKSTGGTGKSATARSKNADGGPKREAEPKRGANQQRGARTPQDGPAGARKGLPEAAAGGAAAARRGRPGEAPRRGEPGRAGDERRAAFPPRETGPREPGPRETGQRRVPPPPTRDRGQPRRAHPTEGRANPVPPEGGARPRRPRQPPPQDGTRRGGDPRARREPPRRPRPWDDDGR